MTIQEQRRKAFEDYVTDQGEWPQAAKRNAEGNYTLMQTFQDWQVWNAALDSVEVPLPAKLEAQPYACYEGGWNDALLEAADAIEAAGVRVKP
jgi:hypothetical protein